MANRYFRIRDETDNGEFITTATVDLIEDDEVVETRTFTASSEDPPEGELSAYGNGKSNHASTQARSYAWGWIDAADVETALAPFGPEWEREQQERHA